ncbi:MAG: transporter substrate-binding domain-containing protein [Porphyromonadaceae bacterium]|nr:transporter substrate-binding domain-containing protein [Porphyromonadaceae bacterium]
MKIRRRTYIYAGLLALALGAMLYLAQLRTQLQEQSSVSQTIRDYPEIAQEGVLRLLAPFNAYDYEGETHQMTGGVYRLAQELGKRTGLKIEVVLENGQDRGLQMLLNGEVDLIASPRVRTSGVDTLRYQWVQDRTSGPIYLVGRKDSLSVVHSHLDLAGKVITLPKASALRLFVDHLQEEIGEGISIELDPLYSTEQLIILVASGKRDYTLCTSEEAEHYRQKFPDLDITFPMSYSLREGWLARRSSPALVDSLKVWL